MTNIHAKLHRLHHAIHLPLGEGYEYKAACGCRENILPSETQRMK